MYRRPRTALALLLLFAVAFALAQFGGVSLRSSRPAAPTGVRADGGAGAVDVRWRSVRGADDYDVRWRGPGGGWSTRRVARTSTSITGLDDSTTYRIQVRARVDGATSPWSRQATTTTDDAAAAPDPDASAPQDEPDAIDDPVAIAPQS